MTNKLAPIPNTFDFDSKAILKKAASAHRYLAELKGLSATIPNQDILINTLSLQEAKDSSAIENIITTNDELYKEQLFPEHVHNPVAKEVQNYATALKKGFKLVRENGHLTSNSILLIQEELEKNSAGFRKVPGTDLKNAQTGEVVYTPPQDYQTIVDLMNNLEQYINDESLHDADILVKMAVIHYQFESIHPFYDGNGRTGRIINVLYLVLKGLLDIPVLYLSRHIISTKNDYYRLLQAVREKEAWEEWVLYILTAVETTSIQTLQTVQEMKLALMDYKHRIRSGFKFYSQDLINNLFFHPYTKIEFVQNDLKISRLTATKYLEELTAAGFLKKEKVGRANYFVNAKLFEILSKVSTSS
ncbi:MAG: Fic family protein [Fibrobacteres bacterium]|nr:Fic family protein [Fibrobacterota bacterium]